MLLTRKSSPAGAGAPVSSLVSSVSRGVSRAIPTMDRRAFLRRSGLGVGAGLAAGQLTLVRKGEAQSGGAPNAAPAKDLLEKRGRKDGYKPITVNDLPGKFGTFSDIAEALYSDTIKLSDLDSIKPWFTLNPPKGGFKRKTKKQYSQGGILGENKELIDIVRRMM